MAFIIFGTSHKYSSLSFLEKVSFSRKDVLSVLRWLKASPFTGEAAILSTCNRLEIYACADPVEAFIEELGSFFVETKSISPGNLSDCFYRMDDALAVRHLFRVACGLDSLVVGERQICHQVRDALCHSREAGAAGGFINEVFTQASFFSDELRRKYSFLGEGLSVGSAAFEFIKKKVPDLNNKKVLIVGAGKVSGLLLECLKKERLEYVFISSRTFEKAAKFAAAVGGRAFRFNELENMLKESDIVISATRSPSPVITRKDIDKRRKPILIIDLAMPRDVDSGVREIDCVELYNLDDLGLAGFGELNASKTDILEIERAVSERAECLSQILDTSLIRPDSRRIWPSAPSLALGANFSSPAKGRQEKSGFIPGTSVKLGVRPSPLAVRQAQEFCDRFEGRGVKFEIVMVETEGDRDKATALSGVEGSDFFTCDLDSALIEGSIDIAVHSAKDLPDKLREGLQVAWMGESIDPYDCLVSKGNKRIEELKKGAFIGTSSESRKRQLRAYRADFKLLDIRGNIEERLALLESRELDAIVIACAGLLRLGLSGRISQRIPPDIIRPHPLQGRLAAVIRSDDRKTPDLFYG